MNLVRAAGTRRKSGYRERPKYPWQKAVFAALESSAEFLPLKVNAAERAIAARLTDGDSPSLDERLALESALRSLRILLPEKIRAADSAKKTGIA